MCIRDRNVEEASNITVQVIQSLTSKVEDVQSFVGSIIEISNQTNLLALNASIAVSYTHLCLCCCRCDRCTTKSCLV